MGSLIMRVESTKQKETELGSGPTPRCLRHMHIYEETGCNLDSTEDRLGASNLKCAVLDPAGSGAMQETIKTGTVTGTSTATDKF